MRRIWMLLLAVVLAGCPSEPTVDDGGAVDGGDRDVGATDGGDVDAGSGDASTSDGGAAPVCGDRVVTPPETCDDGNTTAGDGCSGTCAVEPSSNCGDSIVDRDMGEECDDGNTSGGDGCSATCRVEVTASCGDGTLDGSLGEECDDGNTSSGDGCSATCQLERVGAFCGDGTLDTGERCDDANLTNGDACNPTCNFANATTLFVGMPGVAGNTEGVGTAARLGAVNMGTCGANGSLAADNTYVYFADSNNRVLRRIEVATATTSALAGNGAMALADAADGSMASFNNFEGLATDGVTLWVGDSCRIRAVSLTPPHAVTTVAGGPCVPAALAATIVDGVGPAATWSDLRGLTYYRGLVYGVDANAAVLRSFDPMTNRVTTLAGMAGATGATDGVGAAARFVSPRYMASDNSGMLYVADTNGATIRAFNTVTNEVTTYAGNGTPGIVDGVGPAARIGRPRGLTSDGTSLYWVEFNAHVVRQGELANQSVTTMIGMANTPGYTEGVGLAAQMRGPFGVTFHYPTRSLFFLDGGNCVIRRVR